MSTATDMLANYIAAETAILAGQSFTINGHSYAYANLKDVRDGREYWQAEVNKENSGATGRKSYAVADFTE